ncbi:DUF3618 domain-containing protein [Sciscionella marina]|uniref:DUF3618 domain-containing protein n=1 Tax=Sciscionella marina TaxID=508770 RepID=UPI00035D2C34|nr:DUF3618 domain-containing protein [Sciscionella marina]
MNPQSGAAMVPESDTEKSAQPGKDASADELVSDIERTREELGNTVDALSEKFDVKAQAQHALHDVAGRATEQAQAARIRGDRLLTRVKDTVTDDGSPKPAVPISAVLFAVLLTALWIRARRRR